MEIKILQEYIYILTCYSDINMEGWKWFHQLLIRPSTGDDQRRFTQSVVLQKERKPETDILQVSYAWALLIMSYGIVTDRTQLSNIA